MSMAASTAARASTASAGLMIVMPGMVRIRADVFIALVGCTVFADGDAGVRCADLYVEVRVADAVADLLKGSAGGKHRKAGGKRNHTRRGKPCRNTHHIALGNAAVEEAVGIRRLEFAGLGRLGKVCVEDNEVRILCAELDQRVAVCLTGSFLCQSWSAPPGQKL